MKRNKVSKLQMRRLAAGVTIALLTGTCQVMADQSTNPISESEVFTADRLAQVVNKNNMPKERFKSVAAGILGYTHDKASIKTINIDMAGHDLTLDLTKVADLGTDYSAYGIRRIIRQLSWLTAIKPIRGKTVRLPSKRKRCGRPQETAAASILLHMVSQWVILARDLIKK